MRPTGIVNREYHSWQSPSIGRKMELLVFGHSGARVIVFPTRDGRFYDYENWKMVEALRAKIDAGYIQLFCVDSIDKESLYADWSRPGDRMRRHLDYEKYILQEVAPFTASKNPNYTLIAHGCSLGAYHAMNIALRHPECFGKVVSLSGRYDLTECVGSFRGLFDGYYDDDIYFNNPSHFLPCLNDETILGAIRRMEIVLVIGEEDSFLKNNEKFSQTMRDRCISHQFVRWEGEAHRPRCWRQMVRHYL
jgi:esterase/lipase superfamily enzyme